MKSKTSTLPALIAVALLGQALLPACAAESTPPAQAASAASVSFKTLDTDRNGYLSMQEFTAKGLDDLAFRAADIDNDGRVDSDEYAKYSELKATDPLKSGSGAAEPIKPRATPSKPAGYPYGY